MAATAAALTSPRPSRGAGPRSRRPAPASARPPARPRPCARPARAARGSGGPRPAGRSRRRRRGRGRRPAAAPPGRTRARRSGRRRAGVVISSTTTRPPGRTTRAISARPASRSATLRMPKATVAASNASSSNGSARASATRKVAELPRRAALARARATISSEKSTPTAAAGAGRAVRRARGRGRPSRCRRRAPCRRRPGRRRPRPRAATGRRGRPSSCGSAGRSAARCGRTSPAPLPAGASRRSRRPVRLAPARDQLVRDAELVERLGDHEVDHVVDRARQVVEAPAPPAAPRRPARVTAAMFSMWTRLSGVSRVISTSRRRSFSITSAQRWMRLRAAPVAIAPRVEPEQGAISAAGARDEPEAKGAVRSFSPSTVTAPGRDGEALDEGRDGEGRVVGRPRAGLEDLVADDVRAGVAHAEAHLAAGAGQGPQGRARVEGTARSGDSEEDPLHDPDGSCGAGPLLVYSVPSPLRNVPSCWYCSGVNPVKAGMMLPGGSFRKPS